MTKSGIGRTTLGVKMLAGLRGVAFIVLTTLVLTGFSTGIAARALADSHGMADAEPKSEATASPQAPDELEYDPLFDEEDENQLASFPDPLESINRVSFVFNSHLDRWLLEPITRTYRYLVPTPARICVRNLLSNLNTLPVLLNDAFQLEFSDAGDIGARFLVNTTVGIGGLFDPAGHWGLEEHESDFGQTLSLAGFNSGPYLVLPVLGPMNVRDGTGQIVDTFLRPTTYLLGPSQLMFYGGTAGIVTREEHATAIRALRESSVDFYAAMRNAYYQNRMAQIWSRREHRRLRPD